MKKVMLSIFLIVAVVLVAAIGVSAYSYGSTRYGAVYYYDSPYYSYYPIYYPGTQYASYYNTPPNPWSSDWVYRYGYPAPVQELPGQLCGLIDGQKFGCAPDYLCAYGRTSVPGVGVCIPSNSY